MEAPDAVLGVPAVRDFESVLRERRSSVRQRHERRVHEREIETAQLRKAITDDWDKGWTHFNTSLGSLPCYKELQDKGYEITIEPWHTLSTIPQTTYKIVWDATKVPTRPVIM